MVRHRLKQYATGSSQMMQDRLFLPLRFRSATGGKSLGKAVASVVWLLSSLSLVVFSVYCTWTFYPSSLDTQRQIAVVQRWSSSDGASSSSLPPPIHRSLQDRLRKRRIAWLMSFPNSGTTFTLANMERVTNMSTATNYDNEVLSDVIYPLNPEHHEAPFIFSPHLHLPTYVLTKTHCVGYCDSCHHSTMTYDVASFQFGCMKASVQRECWTDRRFYNVDDVKKAVHLLRNPFDNIVSRLHLHVQERRRDGSVAAATLDQFTETREGLAAWCTYVDDMFQVEQASGLERENGGYNPISDATMQMLKTVPCHSEWFRYTQWHNLTTLLLDERLVEKHVLYYEDYSEKFGQTVRRLSDFLEQSMVQDPLPFVPGKTYGHLYSDDEKRAIAKLIYSLSAKETWSVLSRYLAEYIDEPHGKDVTPDIASVAGTPPKIVWLLSFPQAGAKFVMDLVESMSQATVGTHNGRELDPTSTRKVWPDQTYSPLYTNTSLSTPARLLTRTHCVGGASNGLPIEDYVVFSRNCRTVATKEKGEMTVGNYRMNMTDGAITLVRNPFDVLHTRMKRRTRQVFNWTESEWLGKRDSHDGLLEYCKFVDDEYVAKDKGPYTPKVGAQPPFIGIIKKRVLEWRLRYLRKRRAFTRKTTCPAQWFASRESRQRYSLMEDETGQEEFEYYLEKRKGEFRNYPLDDFVKKAYTNLPCYSEWLRYIQFHNYALDVMDKIPGKVFYFEQFLDGYADVAQQLLDYLRLPRRGSAIPFDKRRAKGVKLYTAKESRLAARLVRALGTDATWETLRVYFEAEDWYDPNMILGTKQYNSQAVAQL